MPVQITINGDNAAQAIEEFATLSAAFGGSAAPSATVSEEPKQRTRKTNEVKKEEKKETPVKTATQDDEAGADGDTKEVEIPSVADLRAKALEVGKGPKKLEIKKLLEEFDCKAISDVPEEKRISFMAELEAL